MKIGYSNILGEHLQAASLHHKDCEPFQVVCPACREPVFKVVRADDGETIHYLSHYAAAKAYQADCELRVAGIGAETIDQGNRVSREQRLRYFLQVLRDLIAQDTVYTGTPDKAQKLLNRAKAIGWMRLQQYEMGKKLSWSRSDFSEAVADYLKDLAGVGANLETSFAIAVQERIAYDIWGSLLSAKGRPNYEFLFNHGYIRLVSRMATAADQRQFSPQEQQMYSYLVRLIDSGKHGGMQMIGEMVHIPVGPPFAEPGTMMLGKLMSEVMHEMIGTLVALPYFEVLKQRLVLPQSLPTRPEK